MSHNQFLSIILLVYCQLYAVPTKIPQEIIASIPTSNPDIQNLHTTLVMEYFNLQEAPRNQQREVLDLLAKVQMQGAQVRYQNHINDASFPLDKCLGLYIPCNQKSLPALLVGASIFKQDEYELYPDIIAIHPEWQRKKIGTILLQLLEKKAENEGLPKISLMPTSNAIPFYIQCGYTKDTYGYCSKQIVVHSHEKRRLT